MTNTSENKNILSQWARWHFYEVPEFLLGVWKNYIFFALNYFSVGALLKSLFAPWRKYKWVYPKGINVVEFLNTFFSNIFSRSLGALMRIVLIAVGIIFQLAVLVLGLIIFIGWILIPFIVITGFLFVFLY